MLLKDDVENKNDMITTRFQDNYNYSQIFQFQQCDNVSHEQMWICFQNNILLFISDFIDEIIIEEYFLSFGIIVHVFGDGYDVHNPITFDGY